MNRIPAFSVKVVTKFMMPNRFRNEQFTIVVYGKNLGDEFYYPSSIRRLPRTQDPETTEYGLAVLVKAEGLNLRSAGLSPCYVLIHPLLRQ